MSATSHIWLLSCWNVASAAEELSFLLCLILPHLNLESHMWQVAIVLNSTVLNIFILMRNKWWPVVWQTLQMPMFEAKGKPGTLILNYLIFLDCQWEIRLNRKHFMENVKFSTMTHIFWHHFLLFLCLYLPSPPRFQKKNFWTIMLVLVLLLTQTPISF